MTRRTRKDSDPSVGGIGTGGALAKRATAERRDDGARRTLEMLLDRMLRPRQWAARAAHALGFQGAKGTVVDRHLLPIARSGQRRPLRVAFASDFHAGATTSQRALEAACEALVALAPDVLILGGDFVTVRADYIDSLAPLLARIPAPLGKFAVLGNHDLRSNVAVVRKALDDAGVQVLVNEAVRLPAPHDDVTIVGLDDPIRGQPDASALDGVAGVRIVAMHAPDGLLALGDRHFDLAVCGHTHGGQVVLPGGFMPYLPSGELSRTYPVGLYRLGLQGGRALLVSRGVGCSTIPIRVFSPPEVHLFTIG